MDSGVLRVPSSPESGDGEPHTSLVEEMAVHSHTMFDKFRPPKLREPASLADILSGNKSKKEIVEIVDASEQPVEALEEKEPPKEAQKPSVSPMELFRMMREKDRKMEVVLKIDADRLASMTSQEESIEIPSDDDLVEVIPSDTEETAKVSVGDLLRPQQKPKPPKLAKSFVVKRTKKKFMVRIPLGSELLASVMPKPRVVTIEDEDPLHSKGNTHLAEVFASAKRPVYSFFSDVSARADQAALDKEQNVFKPWKMKEMEVPVLKRDELLVGEANEWGRSEISLKQRQKASEHTRFSPEETLEFLQRSRLAQKSATKHTTRTYHDTDISELQQIASQKTDMLTQDKRLARVWSILGDPFEIKRMRNSPKQWCDIFAPKGYPDLMCPTATSRAIDNWIINAFKRLKSINTVARQEKLSRRRKREEDDFIVDEDEMTDEEVFVPLLILQGPTGSGKTAAVYAIGKEELAGHVFEINTSQVRAKKDISFHLKQIGTTQTVNANTDGDAKTGIILFDDCDVLFEDDKDFWPAISGLMSYSHRPIVLTCESVDSIPPKIIEHASLYDVQYPKRKVLQAYLAAVALIMGFDVDARIIETIAKPRDVRKSLMELSLVCAGKVPKHTLIRVHFTVPEPEPRYEPQDLEALDAQHDYMEGLGENLGDTDFRDDYCQYFTSKAFCVGSRHVERRWESGYEYVSYHPRNSFSCLSLDTFASDVAPYIREIARCERSRDPKEFFEDVSLILR